MLRISVLFLSLLSFFQLSAQILDDSTKLVYSPKSVQYILENDVLNNIDSKNHPDTLLNNFEFVGTVGKNLWQFQDLGNIGIGSQSLTFQAINDINQQSGYSVFNLYAPKVSDFQYYNTKSPYTNIYYIQGFKGYSQIDFIHSQNINKQLNFTFKVSKFNAAKQYGGATKEEQLINHWNYDFTSNYVSINSKYLALAAVYHFNHLQNEQGGILGGTNLSVEPESLNANYSTSYSSQFAKGTYSRERWNNFHLFQQYKLLNGFQVYFTTDLNHQKYFYLDNNFKVNKTAVSYNLANYSGSQDSLNQNTLFKTFNNKFGIKGRLNGFDYRVYARLRNFNYLAQNHDAAAINKKGTESFVGGQLAYYLKDSLNRLLVDGEIGVRQTVQYFLNANLNLYNFEGSFNISQRPVGLFFQEFNNSILSWKNNFNAIQQYNLELAYQLKLKNLVLKPSFKNVILTNYVYLNNEMSPVQSVNVLNISTLQNYTSFAFKKFTINNTTVFNISLPKNNELYLPKIMSNFHFESNFKYAKVLNLNWGVDLYYKSQFYGNGYAPMLQQFYVQNSREVWTNGKQKGMWIVDPFVAFKMNKVRIALKYCYLNQKLFGKGFYSSPYYINNPGSLYLKVDWPLFD